MVEFDGDDVGGLAARAPVMAPAPGPISTTVWPERSPSAATMRCGGLRVVEEVLAEFGFWGMRCLDGS